MASQSNSEVGIVVRSTLQNLSSYDKIRLSNSNEIEFESGEIMREFLDELFSINPSLPIGVEVSRESPRKIDCFNHDAYNEVKLKDARLSRTLLTLIDCIIKENPRSTYDIVEGAEIAITTEVSEEGSQKIDLLSFPAFFQSNPILIDFQENGDTFVHRYKFFDIYEQGWSASYLRCSLQSYILHQKISGQVRCPKCQTFISQTQGVDFKDRELLYECGVCGNVSVSRKELWCQLPAENLQEKISELFREKFVGTS